jgi:hypothetical protein
MNFSRNFWSIRVIIFVNNLCSIHLIDLERGLKSFILRTKRLQTISSSKEKERRRERGRMVRKEKVKSLKALRRLIRTSGDRVTEW